MNITAIIHELANLPIPPAADIADRAAAEAREAREQGDTARAARLDRVRMNVLRGANILWHHDELLVSSVNTPGAVYAISETGCTCPALKPCWHEELAALLVDMQDDALGDADFEAEPEEEQAACPEPVEGPAPWSHESAIWLCEQRRKHGLDVCGRPKDAPSRPLSGFAQRDAEEQRRAKLAEERAQLEEQRAARELRRKLAVEATRRLNELFA